MRRNGNLNDGLGALPIRLRKSLCPVSTRLCKNSFSVGLWLFDYSQSVRMTFFGGPRGCMYANKFSLLLTGNLKLSSRSGLKFAESEMSAYIAT